MWKFFGWLFLAIVIASSCATLNQNEIKTASHKIIEEQQIIPMLDYYGERVDILRNKTEVRGGANNEGTEDMPYHDAGFYLGNGLFYDLNGNFCLLPLDAFFDLNHNFILHKEDKSGILKSAFVFSRSDSLLSIESNSKIGFTKNYEINGTDSLITFVKGKLMKMEFEKKANGSYFYKRALSNEDIRKTKNGFFIKKLLSKDHYIVKGNEILLADQVIVKYRDNMIEIFKKGWSKPVLKYQMLVDNNSIILYDKKYRGYKLEKRDNKLVVSKNQKVQYIYEMQP